MGVTSGASVPESLTNYGKRFQCTASTTSKWSLEVEESVIFALPPELRKDPEGLLLPRPDQRCRISA